MTYFAFPTTLTRSDGRSTVTAFNIDADEPVFVADSSHPMFDEIVAGLQVGDPNVWDLFNAGASVMSRFNTITDRVSWNGTDVLWDGDPIHSTLADQLARALQDGNPDNYVALAKFWEKLESNPSEHSREQAYDWLASHAFQITAEGDVVGFKGVARKGDGFVSTWASRVSGVPSAFVDGQPVPPLSHVPNNVGTTVTMPRSEVVHDPRQACERGLHVSTRGYANSYGSAILEVHVNPRDIVSVPTDGGGAKVRTCRYYIAGLVQAESIYGSPVLRSAAPNSVWAGDVGTRV